MRPFFFPPVSFPFSNPTIRLNELSTYFYKPLMELLTTKEVAKLLGMPVRQVPALITNGRVPATKFGRDYMIDEKDLKLVENRQGR